MKNIYHAFTDRKDKIYENFKDAKKQIKRWKDNGETNLRIYSINLENEMEECIYSKGEFPY